MRPPASSIVVTMAVFVLFHTFGVVVPILSSGASGESQAFAAAIFDMPIWWLLGLFPTGQHLAYSSHTFYVLVFCIGGTFMYAVIGAMIGYGIHRVIRAIRAA